MNVTRITDDAAFAATSARLAGSLLAAADADDAARLASVQAIVDNVRTRGDEAVAEYTAKFDRVNLTPDRFEVTPSELDRASNAVDRATLAALERAHANILDFHSKNLRQSWEHRYDDGSVVGQRVTAIESVGLYVPGGTAFYPSSVLMNIVPARVAGVAEIVVVSPPSDNGDINPLVLAAARVAGATRVFRVGGAQAIAALAYGTKTIPSVLKIAGPGNAYVTLAKRIVSSTCDIDKEAGPSEVVVIADDSADPRLAAIELLAQAEHDEDARPLLVVLSDAMLARIQDAIENELPALPRAPIIKESLARKGEAFVVRSIDEACRLTNVIAPEHLSIQTKDPGSAFEKIQNVGCAVLGGQTSVAVGDYYAGPNHILPTERKARFASPLTAEDFRKVTSIISFSKSRMTAVADDIMLLARAEKLDAHARAVELRK